MTQQLVVNLPELDDRQLSRSPLSLVVCQIRFENNLSVGDQRLGGAVHDALGGREGDYPIATPAQGQNLNVNLLGDNPAVSTSTVSGWRFASKDDRWVVTLMPDHASIETSAYTTWSDDYEARLGALLEAVAEHVKPTTEMRLGLRYVDRIADVPVEKPVDWASHIQAPLLGPLLHEQLGPGILASRQHVLMRVTDEIQCGLNHGFLIEPDENKPVYLLDYDLFRDEPRSFDAAEIIRSATSLHEYAVRLFHASVRSELLEVLR